MTPSRPKKRLRHSADIPAFLAVAGIVFYSLLFFQSAFGPLASAVPCRAFLPAFLLNPAIFVELWCGEPAQFAVLDRLPSALLSACSLLAAYGLGLFTLRAVQATKLLDSLERFVFSVAIGLSLFSTLLLILGLTGLAGQSWAVRGLTVVPALYGAWMARQERKNGTQSKTPSLAILGLFAMLAIPYLLAFPLPPVEYDVVSYHLPGVKETFLTGTFAFRPDSVYMNMPFGAEMYCLWGMLLDGDWYHGALAGKITLGFAGSLLPAAALFTFGRRFFTQTVGVIAAVLYLTTPWVHYVSVTGLIDCVVATYLFLAIYALAVFRCSGTETPTAFLFLSGFLAGGAVSCKYPALLFAVVPLGVMVWSCSFSYKVRNLAVFSIAALLACGLWFGKNAAFTGNPVYPLLHNVFGDRTGTWTPDKNARWARVHSPPDFTFSSAWSSTAQIVWKSDYHSPILVPLFACGLVPLFFRRKNTENEKNTKNKDRLLFALAAHIFFVLLCWWLLTHRIDRFLIPILPLVAIIAAQGAVLSSRPAWKGTVLVVLGVTVAYSMLLAALPQPGKYNRFFLPMQTMRTDPVRVPPWTQYYNENPPPGTLLLIGEAKVFDFNVPVLFSSCFDDSLFERIAKGKDGSLKPPEEVRRLLREHGISDIYVDWGEIARFRSPGNYGFSEFPEPSVFDALVRRGVLIRNGNGMFRVDGG